MRKEIIGILLFFLVVFTLISLVSYSPMDPSVNNAKAAGEIRNFFGMLGAHIAGLLIGMFGLGAFWIPLILLLLSIHILGGYPQKALAATIAGGLLLVITTGCLLALRQPQYGLLGTRFSSGGMIGIPITNFLTNLANPTGALIILVLIWLIGFIMATGFSLIAFSRRSWKVVLVVGERLKTFYLKHRERMQKARKRSQMTRQQSDTPKAPVKIKAAGIKAPVKVTPRPKQEVFEFMRSRDGFQLPSVSFLEDPEIRSTAADDENLRMQSKLLEKKLEDFGVRGQVVAVSPGPVVTTFEYEPAAGIKINKVVNLSDDLALALRAASIRIVAPIPGKAVIGIEVPNAVREMVRFKEIVISTAFEKSKSYLTICLGKDIIGHPVVAELNRMPHLLIAGATGSGKSVALNTMICSLLYKADPDHVKMIMIDPKRIELTSYDGIPHLITPVVTNVKKATNALYWAVKEMERRYELLSENSTRNIAQYNRKVSEKKTDKDGEPLQPLPFIVVVIDELADLMMVSSRDVEVALTRLAQMARAAGIHLIIATQRPSVDVLTGIIKANFPTRLSFQVSSKTDSRTIIDANGAENLLGSGDMLFVPPGAAKLQRIHGAYISESELARITAFLKQQKKPEYDEQVTAAVAVDSEASSAEEHDEKYDEAVALVAKNRQASISMIQRHLRIGYNRAARIIETMEKEGVVGPADGVKPREVLVRSYDDIS
ncbi:MAG: cell division protein FtsK [Deltaproteobacteria bacterium SG8_13]|nr:MAG: cell division protein FtsK [Deltaproteobacteria bacterium SG8_13]